MNQGNIHTPVATNHPVGAAWPHPEGKPNTDLSYGSNAVLMATPNGGEFRSLALANRPEFKDLLVTDIFDLKPGSAVHGKSDDVIIQLESDGGSVQIVANEAPDIVIESVYVAEGDMVQGGMILALVRLVQPKAQERRATMSTAFATPYNAPTAVAAPAPTAPEVFPANPTGATPMEKLIEEKKVKASPADKMKAKLAKVNVDKAKENAKAAAKQAKEQAKGKPAAETQWEKAARYLKAFHEATSPADKQTAAKALLHFKKQAKKSWDVLQVSPETVAEVTAAAKA